MHYASPTIDWRGRLARLRADVHALKPQHGDHQGTLRCICGASFHFHIQSTGISRGHCSAGCGARWCN